MVNPYVTSATFASGQMTFSVLADDFQGDEEEYIEISGYATQTGGAFANIYTVASIPAKAADGSKPPPVTVQANPRPQMKFRQDQDVTVAIRVSKVWVTVLRIAPLGDETENPPPPPDGTTWNVIGHVSEMYGGSSPPGAS